MYVDDDTNNNDDEVEKTLAIIIGLIAAVALVIVFISFLNKLCEKGKGIYIYIYATPLLLHHFSPSYSFPYLTSFLVFLLQVASKLQFLDIISVCSGK